MTEPVVSPRLSCRRPAWLGTGLVAALVAACTPASNGDDDDDDAQAECMAVETGTGDTETENSWRFDAAGTLVAQRLDGTSDWSTIEYEADGDGRVTEVRVDGATTRELSWDGQGRLTEMLRSSGSLTTLVSYVWDDDGFLESESLTADGAAETVVLYGYDAERLATVEVTAGGFPVRDSTVEWTAGDCLRSLQSTVWSATYEADGDGRLVREEIDAEGAAAQVNVTDYEGGPCLPRRLLGAPGGTFQAFPPFGPTTGPICLSSGP